MLVDVVIPVLNEAEALPHVLAAIPPQVRRVVVADNGSTDDSAARAAAAGAQVVHEPRRGYGAACLKALAHVAADPPQTVVFLDGDHSDHPEEMPALWAPIAAERADLVIGSRTLGRREKGALTPQQQVGNWIACQAMRLGYGASFTDLGPFRAIRWTSLQRLGLREPDYGWTVEMQLRALEVGLRCCEVPVSYRPRIGQSKVSGTVRGTLMASKTILTVLARHLSQRRQRTAR